MPRKDAPLTLPFFDAAPAEAPLRRRPEEPEVVSVAELDRRLRRAVEATGEVRVAGEICNLKVVASGHAYFTLKDEGEDASIECVMYRAAPPRAKRLLVDGARIVIIGRATIYVARGRLQLVADDAKPLGRGALLEALEQLKKKLAAEGLFAAERKRPLPRDPRVIGVVTSGDGAVIHDIITVAFRRGAVRILLARAPVQGAGAAPRVARAVAALDRLPEVDAIIVARGGGSSDDLAVYNDEALVRQIAACRVPVVSAVGHEVDVTLADLVADARAATPSQAAEMLIPDAEARRRVLDQLGKRIDRALSHQLDAMRSVLDQKCVRLHATSRKIGEKQQQIDDLSGRLKAHASRLFARRRARITEAERRLASRHPRAILARARGELGPLEVRLAAAMERRLGRLRRDVSADAGRIEALSPLAVLARGYALVEGPSGALVRDPRDVAVGDMLRLRVHHGTLSARVEGPPTSDRDRDD